MLKTDDVTAISLKRSRSEQSPPLNIAARMKVGGMPAAPPARRRNMSRGLNHDTAQLGPLPVSMNPTNCEGVIIMTRTVFRRKKTYINLLLNYDFIKVLMHHGQASVVLSN